MHRALLLSIFLVAAGFAPFHAASQLRPTLALEEAFFAWDEGRYIDAMEGYLAVLRGGDAEAHRRAAALLTGELHPVRALDDDGRFVHFSPDGRRAAWARNLNGRWETRIVPVRGGGPRIVIPAQRVALSGGGLAAWVEEGAGGAGSDATPGAGSALANTLLIRKLDDPGAEDLRVQLDGARVQALAFQPDAEVLFFTAAPDPDSDRVALFRLEAPEWEPVPVRSGAAGGDDSFPVLTNPVPAAGGAIVLATIPPRSPFSASAETATPTGGPAIALVDVATGRALRLEGSNPTLARGGSRVAWLRAPGGGPGGLGGMQAGAPTGPGRILTLDLSSGLPESAETARVAVETPLRIGDPAISPDGRRLAFKAMPHVDWEVFVVDAAAPSPLDPGTTATPPEGVTRVTREIQHDQFPAWIDDRRILALKGEARHRRSYLYDLETRESYRLFHNNTLRTIAPEYEWVASPDGSAVLIVAERDGDTISPERAVHLVDLGAEVSLDTLIARLDTNLAHERELLDEGRERFAPIRDDVARVTERVQHGRIQHHADVLYRMGSKFIGQPGNPEATEYLAETLRGWGYEVELEWFEPRGFPAANVIARLPGTENPELVYAISSHFDSVLPSPGADDNSSGTTALLEAARVLKDAPRRATIEFAFLTAEEAGLLGAREYVRRAVEGEKRVVGILNNDMIGWSRNHRIDNTIRYSNHGIMRIQHGAAHFFSDLITYDTRYYRGTDGAVFYEAWGDIVGGIGSYPVLGNPNYHQRTDQIETIDHRRVAEVSRATVATIMLLADAPSRTGGVRIAGRTPAGITIGWDEAPETGVTGYRVRIRSSNGAIRDAGVVDEPGIVLSGLRPGDVVEVRAIGAGGLEGWDWAGVRIP